MAQQPNATAVNATPTFAASNPNAALTGTIVTSPLKVATPNLALPAIVVFNSAAGGRAVSVSFDGGTTYYALTNIFTSANQQIFSIPYRVTNIEFVGNAADTYSIL